MTFTSSTMELAATRRAGPKLVLALLIAGVLAGNAQCAPAPRPLPQLPVTADRIGRAQVFDYGVRDPSIMAGRVDLIWGAGSPRADLFSMRYMAVDRDTDRAHDLSWHQARHPAEVVHRCDGSIPDEYGDHYVTLDITSLEVRRRLYQAVTAKAVGYQALAVDNVSNANVWALCSAGGARLYSGRTIDPRFVNATADWLSWLRERAHADGKLLAANHYFTGEDPQGYHRIAQEIDIVVDEHGYSRNCRPIETGASLSQRIALYAELARDKPLVIIDYLCRDPAPALLAARAWSLATYLLVKGDRSYLAMSYPGDFVDFPELHLQIGPPLTAIESRGGLYLRRFGNALAAVNPSADRAASLELPGGAWLDAFTGSAVSGSVTLAPGTAMVLSLSGARACPDVTGPMPEGSAALAHCPRR